MNEKQQASPNPAAGNETLRVTYRPARVTVLFVGESPPASGRFFYARNTGRYRARLAVFQAVDPAITDRTFLDTFRAAGCYLVDLCPAPVDQLPPPLRRAAHRAAEPRLAEEIRQLRPRLIVTTLYSIERSTSRAMAAADWAGPALVLPYPGRWEHLRKRFAAGLTPVLEALLGSGEV